MAMYFDIKPENVLIVPQATSKDEILKALIQKLATNPEIASKDELEAKIFEREALMSTGIGLGIAVPHVRLASVSNVVIALGICADGICDYETLDGEQIKIVCMIAANSEQHNEYIQALATLSKQLKNESVRQRLIEVKSETEAYEFFVKSMN